MPKHPAPQLQPAFAGLGPSRCQMPPDLLGSPACQAAATHAITQDAKGSTVYGVRPKHARYCLQHAHQLAGRKG